MRKSYGEGVANHTGLTLCVAVRKFSHKALIKGSTGQPLSREITIRGADTVRRCGRPHRVFRQREKDPSPARSQTLSMYGNNLRENREILCLPPRRLGGRLRKSKDRS